MNFTFHLTFTFICVLVCIKMSGSETESEKDPIVTVSGVKMRESKRQKLIGINLKVISDSTFRTFLNYGLYFFIIVIVGVPMWWITTSPYRAHLEQFPADFRVEFPFFVKIYFSKSDSTKFNRMVSDLAQEDILKIPNQNGGIPDIDFKANFIQKVIEEDEFLEIATKTNVKGIYDFNFLDSQTVIFRKIEYLFNPHCFPGFVSKAIFEICLS